MLDDDDKMGLELLLCLFCVYVFVSFFFAFMTVVALKIVYFFIYTSDIYIVTSVFFTHIQKAILQP